MKLNLKLNYEPAVANRYGLWRRGGRRLSGSGTWGTGNYAQDQLRESELMRGRSGLVLAAGRSRRRVRGCGARGVYSGFCRTCGVLRPVSR